MQSNIRAATNCDLARVFQRGAYLQIELPRSDPQTVHLSSMEPGQIGWASDGTPIVIELGEPQHTAVIGRTGSGKSCLIDSMAWHAANDGLAMSIIDPHNRLGHTAGKGRQWREYAGSIADGNGVLQAAVEEMRMRYQRGDSEPLLLFCDEAQLLDDTLLKQLATEGRKVGIRLTLGYQYQRAAELDPIVLAQMHTRICGIVNDGRTSERVIGVPDAKGLLRPGDMLGVLGGGAPVRFQAALPDVLDWSNLPSGPPAMKAAPVEQVEQSGERPMPADVMAWIASRHAIDGELPGIHRIREYTVKHHGSCGVDVARRWKAEARRRLRRVPVRPQTIQFPAVRTGT